MISYQSVRNDWPTRNGRAVPPLPATAFRRLRVMHAVMRATAGSVTAQHLNSQRHLSDVFLRQLQLVTVQLIMYANGSDSNLRRWSRHENPSNAKRALAEGRRE